MIDQLAKLFPNFGSLQESVLQSHGAENIWQVTVLGKDTKPVGSGYAKDLNTARKIAVAEFIERTFVLNLKKTEEVGEWQLDQFPTACGFAAGFDPINTQIRSIGEALERWALAQWLDNGCFLEQDYSPVWAKESQVLLKEFETSLVYKKDFLYSHNERVIPYSLCVVVCLNGNGAFIGSGVKSSYQDAMVHAVVEAHRHLLISSQNRNFDIFPYNRIKYFAENKKVALDLLQAPRNNQWPKPVLKFQRSFQNELFCISRTIFEDWIPWERGAIDRMLY